MKRKVTAIFIILIALLMLCLSACGKVEFKVNFVVDGEIYATVDTNGNEVIKMPENPTKEGCNFDGWYWDKDEWEKPFTANSLLDAPLSSDMSVYAKFVSNEVPLTQDFVVSALKTMPNIVAVSAATEYNDPNGQLNKPGGYIADIFFSVDVINQNLITGTTLVEKGTDAGGSIEIYRTQKDAEKRNEYLAAFDGGILSSGSHKVIGTCVVRTSDSLTASLQNILENNIEKALTGSTEAFVSMDTYLIEIAKQVAEEEKLSEFEVGTKLIEFGYPLEKAEAIAEICGANFNEIAKGLAEGYADYYATVYPTMIAELLADHEFTEANIEYALENADIDWQFYAKIHARDFVNMNEEEYYISPLDVIVHLNNDKGYTVEDSEYGVWNCEINWNEKALEYIECIEADGILGPKGDYITALTDMEFTQDQAEYAVNNCGNNWNNHALLCLKHFVEDLSTTTPNHAECLAKLKDWGFSDSEANYAISNYDGLIYPDKLDYVIHFNTDGGELSSLTQNVVFGKTYTLPTPTKTGYTFKGWYNGTTEVAAGTWYTASDVTLKAKWEITSYNITYNLNNGANNSSNKNTYTMNDAVVLYAPTRTGYTFTGWTYIGQTTPVMNVTIQKGTTGNKTYTANWQANTYTVTYKVNGGTLADLTVDVVYGSYFKPATPTRTGYSFNGWHYDSGKGYDEEYCNDYYGIAGDVTLEAWWSANTYTITYNANGGTVSGTTQSVTYDGTYTLRTPTRTGYEFLGWYNGGNKVENGTWTSTQGITLKAEWKANTYTRSHRQPKAVRHGAKTLRRSQTPRSARRDGQVCRLPLLR
ncbi:MAG: InlB B-repeat-containing protein [Clostridia bacterium]|nr:InlB B-repeat-containing protein [Clostridia bacterium]